MPSGTTKTRRLTDFDILVIGAGAAGLAAGRRLAQSGAAFLILEARPRTGGRAFTGSAGGHALDHGCGWLHSADRNPWREIAEARGFHVDRSLPDWGKQAFDLGFSPDDQEAFAEASAALDQEIAAAAQKPPDRAAASLLKPGNRWAPLLDAVSTYMSGAELEHISAQDLANYADTEINWRIREGYGAAIADFGVGLPVALNCAARQIDHSGPSIKVDTSTGTLSCGAVIVTVPTTLFLSGALRFRPALPQKLEAAEGLPLGIADKLFIAIDTPDDLPIDGHLFGRADSAQTASYHLRPFGRPLIECYFGGSLARSLEVEGPGAFFSFACDELAGLFGETLRDRLHFVVTTSWAQDPLSLGSYSYAKPGCAAARQKLAEPVDRRLFFAGEACSTHDFSTAHGAYESGIRAAEQAIAAMMPSSAIKAS